MTKIDKTTHRQHFPSLTNKFYFNYGGQGPMPQAALEAIIDAHQYLQHNGPFGLKVYPWIEHHEFLLKKALADELGAQPTEITLTENVTVGCNIPLWGINWQEGDHILITDCEHHGIIAIIQEISRRFKVEFSVCPIMETLNHGNPVEVIEKHLQANTRLVVLSHLLWNTGQVLPLEEIVHLCHNYKGNKPVQVLVDAAQSAGSLPLNLNRIKVDFYAFTGHKWFCGPAGVGALYISTEAMNYINPTFIGWRGINIDEKGKPTGWKDGASRFEVATCNIAAYEGLRLALAIHREFGSPYLRYKNICDLSKYLWEKLSEIDGIRCLKSSPPDAGLVSFQVVNGISNVELVKYLEKEKFFLRTLKDPNCIRACIHYFSTLDEIDNLTTEIKKIFKTN